MLENFSIYMKYHVNGAKKCLISQDIENDDYIITNSASIKDQVVLTLAPKNGNVITIEEFSVIYPYDFLPRYKQFQKIFTNGYQSSSLSREYFPNENSPFYKDTSIESYSGNSLFVEPQKGMGKFISNSYTYLRNNDDVELFASLNEATGFTIFYIDVMNKTIKATKDLEGIAIERPYEVMCIARYYNEYDKAFDEWFKDMRIPAPREKHITGYTTWYNHYDKIDENVVFTELDNITSLDTKVDVFEIDDGYESAVGDWTTCSKGFSDMGSMADAIHEKGMKAGLWLAPFAVSSKSNVYKEHPDWLVTVNGKPFKAGNKWGGMYTLDIYKNEVRLHLRELFETILNSWGYDLVKLDLLYQVAIIPYNNKSRGEIVTDAIALLRDLCGKKLILACGTPVVPAFGKADFCRIGPDMDLKWGDKNKGSLERISTNNALNNTVFRRHLDGRGFVNDPDVFILRDNNMKLTPKQRVIMAKINMIFGNVMFTSDDVSRYKRDWQLKTINDMFGDTKIKIMGAEYVTNDILHIKTFINDVPNLITIDMKKGNMLDQEVDAKDLKVSDIDEKLTARGGENYEDALSSEDDNYDDFDFDRELTEEEKAEIAKAKQLKEEARQQKINEMIEKHNAEKEAKRKAILEAREAQLAKIAEEKAKKQAEKEAEIAKREAMAPPKAEAKVEDKKDDVKAPAEAPKTEAPKTEAPKAEAPKTEAPKAPATPKTEVPKAPAAPKAEAPKAPATPKAEAPKAPAAPKAETPKAPAAPKTEAPKAEPPKATKKAEPKAPPAPPAPPKSAKEAVKEEAPKKAAAPKAPPVPPAPPKKA